MKMLLSIVVHGQWSCCFVAVIQKYCEQGLHVMFSDGQ